MIDLKSCGILSPINRILVALLLLLLLTSFSNGQNAQETNQAPDGFTALFNGTDLSGWHGMGHFNPTKLAAMPEADRKAKRATDWENRSTTLVSRQW